MCAVDEHTNHGDFVMPESQFDTTPEVTPPEQRSLLASLKLSLILTVIVTGITFWSGYSILRSPEGWAGGRRFIATYFEGVRNDLQKYHDEYGEYPETLRDAYPRMQNWCHDGDIILYRHPVLYERTESGWSMTDFGADGLPGGAGLNADLVMTNETKFEKLNREIFHNTKYHATFEQVRASGDGSDFQNLMITTGAFGFLVFLAAFGVVHSMKRQHIRLTVMTMIFIAIPAVIVGLAIMGVHNVASGH